MAQPADDPDIAAAMERLLLRIGKDAHALRERQGWSQDAVARAAGLHPDTISAIERGTTVPDLQTLIRLFFIHGYEVQLALRPTRPYGTTS